MKFRHTLFSALPMLISTLVIAWCGFYLLFGANSIFNLRALEVQEMQLKSHLASARAQREDIEDRVMRLRPDTLDWDLVEEQAQAKLGTRAPNTEALPM